MNFSLSKDIRFWWTCLLVPIELSTGLTVDNFYIYCGHTESITAASTARLGVSDYSIRARNTFTLDRAIDKTPFTSYVGY